jgi:hypothetical protein
MAELYQLARPVMRRAACFDTNQARRQFGEKRQHLRSSKQLANYHLAGCVNTVDLKNALGQVETDRGNLHGGWLPFCS